MTWFEIIIVQNMQNKRYSVQKWINVYFSSFHSKLCTSTDKEAEHAIILLDKNFLMSI